MTVKVIRVLEYTFPDQATAEQQLSHLFVPANGVKFVGQTVIRSATTWPEEMPPARQSDNEEEQVKPVPSQAEAFVQQVYNPHGSDQEA